MCGHKLAAEQIRVLVQARPLPGALHRLCVGTRNFGLKFLGWKMGLSKELEVPWSQQELCTKNFTHPCKVLACTSTQICSATNLCSHINYKPANHIRDLAIKIQFQTR